MTRRTTRSARSGTSTARRDPSRSPSSSPSTGPCTVRRLAFSSRPQRTPAIGVGAVMKLLASAAALVCALCLAPPALAGGSADFERSAPDRASARIVAPRPFNLVGLRWRGNAAPDVEIRVGRGGRWSRWRPLGVHGAGGSDPAWVGRARVVQYRLSRRVPRLRLHFVSVAKPLVRARAAQAVDTPFPYVPREQWAGNQCPPRTAPSYGTVKAVAV